MACFETSHQIVVEIRREQEESTYDIERPGFAGANLPQNLERAQSEIARLKIFEDRGRVTRMSEWCYLQSRRVGGKFKPITPIRPPLVNG